MNTHKPLITRVAAILLFIFLSAATNVNINAQGLKFAGLESRIDERTSLEVFGKHKKSFHDCFNLEFLMATCPKADFGYICRIKEAEEPYRIWNLSYDGRGEDMVSIRINEEGRYSVIKAEFPRSDLQEMHWTDVRISFDLLKDSLMLEIAGHTFKAAVENLPDKFSPELYFGRSEHIIDVPNFSLRNLRISDRNKCYTFLFDEVKGNVAKDTKGLVSARVENPVWLINESSQWHKIAEMQFDTNAGAIYNPHRGEFYYFDRDRIRIVNTATETYVEKSFTGQCPLELILANCFLNDDGSVLYVYELYYEYKKQESYTIAALDLDKLTWTPLSRDMITTPLHHHISFDSPQGHTVFGGFGEMKYSGKFWNLGEDWKWKELWSDGDSTLHPRYFTSGGVDGSGRYLYIFGGMGNESGEQIVGRHYYYDLHRVELESGKIEKLWDRDRDGAKFVPVRNLLVAGDSLYTLCYPEHIGNSELSLYRISVNDGSYEVLDDRIPIISDKILTNANLWYDEDMEKLYASVQVYDDDIKSELKLYSLAFPPLFGYESGKNTSRTIILAAVFGVLLLLGAAAAFFFARRRRRELLRISREVAQSKSDKTLFRQDIRPNSIYLFGDFMAYDRDGKDITISFTTQQKQLLGLLLKYNDKGGIYSKKLSNILWPDKEEDKVKNSRGVAINHLRRTLSNFDGIELLYNDGSFRLECTDSFYCDYMSFSTLMSTENPDKEQILNILSNGKFLAFMDEPIFDTFKEKVEESAMSILQKEIANRFSLREYQAVTEIAKMIFNIDPLDEATLALLVKSLRKLKRTDEALVQYAKFAAEYRKVYDSEYAVPFDKI